MTISKKFLNIMLVLVLLSGIGSVVYFARENALRVSALEESIEYQVLTAIEAQNPGAYVVAVKPDRGHVFVYVVLPEEITDDYLKALLFSTVTILHNAYPIAETYHILPTKITDADTFEGTVHVGVANMGFGFTNKAAGVIATSEYTSRVLTALFQSGEAGNYSARAAGLHIIQEPTPRELGHIPPWATVEE